MPCLTPLSPGAGYPYIGGCASDGGSGGGGGGGNVSLSVRGIGGDGLAVLENLDLSNSPSVGDGGISL